AKARQNEGSNLSLLQKSRCCRRISSCGERFSFLCQHLCVRLTLASSRRSPPATTPAAARASSIVQGATVEIRVPPQERAQQARRPSLDLRPSHILPRASAVEYVSIRGSGEHQQQRQRRRHHVSPVCQAARRRLMPNLPQSPKQRQKAFSTTLVGFVKAGDAESALLMYGKAGEVGCNITENVFNAVLSVCDGDKASWRGVSIFSDMIAAGVRPRENHYAFLLREATGRGAFEEAFSKVREMVEGGVQPRLRTYSALLKGLCNKPDMAFAFQVWSHMTAQGVTPAPEQYVDMFKGWAAAGELRQRIVDGTPRLQNQGFPIPLCQDAAKGNLAGRSANAITTSTGAAGQDHLQAFLAAFNSDSMFSFTRGDVQTYSPSPVQIASAVGLDATARARVRLALRKLARAEAAQHSLPPLPVAPPPSRRRQSSRLDSAGLEHFAAWLEARRREGVHYTTVVDGCNVAYYGQNKEGGKFQISQVDLMARQLEEEGERVLVVLPERYLRPCVPNSARSRRRKVRSPVALGVRTDEDLEAIDGWRERQMLYSCANGTDDDLFWMYFTVSSDDRLAGAAGGGTAADDGQGRPAGEINGRRRTGADGNRDRTGSGDQAPRGAVDEVYNGGVGVGEGLGVGLVEDGGIDTGFANAGGGGAARLTVVSNDEMRNHRMALLEPVPFKRWRNSQVRGFHFPSGLPDERNGSAAAFKSGRSGSNREEGSPRRDDRHRSPPLLGPPQPPVVWPSPAFTRDMQVRTCKHTWHIPIRGAREEEAGEAGGDEWLCINLAA
ncbi:unnamed protein product, partial [Scytosiphon promiscuus]